jgi:uncharacterized membrane protein YvlD (DUF360 family)
VAQLALFSFMFFSSSNRASVGGMAINWAVNAFVIVLLFAIVIALPELPTISFPKVLVIIGTFTIVLHSLIVWLFSRSIKWRINKTVNDGGAVKALEYTISIVSWILQGVLWWYNALDATAAFLFVPTYFITSLLIFHYFFENFVGHKINKKTLFLLAGNFWTLGHYIIIILRVRESVGEK